MRNRVSTFTTDGHGLTAFYYKDFTKSVRRFCTPDRSRETVVFVCPSAQARGRRWRYAGRRPDHFICDHRLANDNELSNIARRNCRQGQAERRPGGQPCPGAGVRCGGRCRRQPRTAKCELDHKCAKAAWSDHGNGVSTGANYRPGRSLSAGSLDAT